MEEYHSGHGQFEHEIFELRTMLREAREEREKAITMRVAADRERDEATSRFESKSREMDKLEERLAQALHGHGHHHGGHKASSKIIYRSTSNTTAAAKSEVELVIQHVVADGWGFTESCTSFLVIPYFILYLPTVPREFPPALQMSRP